MVGMSPSGRLGLFVFHRSLHSGPLSSGESGEIDGLPVFDAYGPFGPYINDEIKPILAKHNAFADWYDAGTVHITLED